MSFWGYAIQTQTKRADSFGDFVRLVGRRVVARPREVYSLEALRSALVEQRVNASNEVTRNVWTGFKHHPDYPMMLAMRGPSSNRP